MEAVGISWITLLLCLLGGGGNDLLDHLPSETYWKAKNVTVSLESMRAELKPAGGSVKDVAKWIDDLGSSDPQARENAGARIRAAGSAALEPLREATQSPDLETARRAEALLQQISGDLRPTAVRRLMAIRTLGELKKMEARDVLTPLLESKEPFEAEYARTAIATIDGKPPERQRPVEEIRADLWLLPAACRAVGQVAPRGGTPLSAKEVLANFTVPPGIHGASKEEMLDEGAAAVISAAEALGNVRLDAVTFGVSGDLGEDAGYLVIVARGQYDRAWMHTLAKASRVPTKAVAGGEVLQPSGEMWLYMPSDQQLVLVASPDPKSTAMADMVTALKDAGAKGGLKESADMVKRIESVDTTQPLWLVAEVTPAFKQLPVLPAFDSLTLVGKSDKDALNLRLNAEGKDPAQVKAASDQIAEWSKKSADFLAGMQVAPVITTAVEFLRTIAPHADGNQLVATGTLKLAPAPMLSLPTMLDFVAEPEPRDDDIIRPGPRVEQE